LISVRSEVQILPGPPPLLAERKQRGDSGLPQILLGKPRKPIDAAAAIPFRRYYVTPVGTVAAEQPPGV
jgi:hypothetical protein